MRKFIAFGPALVVLLTALVTLVAAPAAVRLIGYASTDAQIQLARQELEQDNILKQIDRAVRNIADAVEPSVVHIAVEEQVRGRYRRQSQGSGWVFDNAGHIVTNAHVVRGASRIMVQFQDGRAVEAERVGQDTTTDIAVIKVRDTEGLFPINRASGLDLHQGDRVYAFGSPFGFKFSMSEGIVSGLGRDPRAVIGRDGYTNFIQTDAAVNPGNSGGPLVNVEGKLVGMNVAIATARKMPEPEVDPRNPYGRSNPRNPYADPEESTDEGQSAGISFAIPLATIESVVEQLVSGVVVSKGYLGITHSGSDEANQLELGRTAFRGRGVLVTGVAPGGPAESAGLQAGDIILKLNEKAVSGVPALRSAITNNLPGDQVTVEVWRQGETQAFMVKLGNLPPTQSEMRNAAEAASRFGIADIGQTRAGEIVITQIRSPSPAAQAGLRPEQTILEVEGTKIETMADFFSALAGHGLHQGREVKMTVRQADGKNRDVTITTR